MVKNPLDRMRRYFDEKDPARHVRRLMRRYAELQWDEVASLMVNERVGAEDKLWLLRRVKPLTIERLAPFVLQQKGYAYIDEQQIAELLIPVMEPFEWSPLITEIFLSGSVSLRERWAFVRGEKIKTPIQFAAIQGLFRERDFDDSLKLSLAECTVGATWDDCKDLMPRGIRNILYFGSTHIDLKSHRFLYDIRKRAGGKEKGEEQYKDKTYVEVVESFAKPLFEKITQELEQVGRLTPHSAEDIAANGNRLMAIAGETLLPEEKASLEKLGIDISKNVLQLYPRIMNGLNYGSVADALQLCTAWFFERGYSRFFSGTRILPSQFGKVPPEPVLARTGAGVEYVMGDAFRALNKLPTVYFSHSAFGGKTPAITSAATEGDVHCVSSRIELEEDERWKGNEFAKNAILEEILREYINNLIALDGKLVEFVEGTKK